MPDTELGARDDNMSCASSVKSRHKGKRGKLCHIVRVLQAFCSDDESALGTKKKKGSEDRKLQQEHILGIVNCHMSRDEETKSIGLEYTRKLCHWNDTELAVAWYFCDQGCSSVQ